MENGTIDELVETVELPSSDELVSGINNEKERILSATKKTVPKRLEERVQTITIESSIEGKLSDMIGVKFSRIIPKAGRIIAGITSTISNIRGAFEKGKFIEDVFERVSKISKNYLLRLAGKKETQHSIGRTLNFEIPDELQEEAKFKSVIGALIHSQIDSLIRKRSEIATEICIEKTLEFVLSQFIETYPNLRQVWNEIYQDQSLIDAIQITIENEYEKIGALHNTFSDAERPEDRGKSFPKITSETHLTHQDIVKLIGAKEFSKATMYYILSNLALRSNEQFHNYGLDNSEQALEIIDYLNEQYLKAEYLGETDKDDVIKATRLLGRTLSMMHDGVFVRNYQTALEKNIYLKEDEISDGWLREPKIDEYARSEIDIIIGDTMYKIPAFVTFENGQFDWIGKDSLDYTILSSEIFPNGTIKIAYTKNEVPTEKIFYPITELRNPKTGQTLIGEFLNNIDLSDPLSYAPLNTSPNKLMRALTAFHDLDSSDREKVESIMRNTIGIIAFRSFENFDEAINIPGTTELMYFDVQIDGQNASVNSSGIFYHLLADADDALRKMEKLAQFTSSPEFTNLLSQYSKKIEPLGIDFNKEAPQLRRIYSPLVREGIAEINLDTTKLVQIARSVNEKLREEYGDKLPFKITVSSVLNFVGSALVATNKAELIKTMKIDTARQSTEQLKSLARKIGLETILVGDQLTEFLESINQPEAQKLLEYFIAGGKYEIVTKILHDLPDGVPPFPGTAIKRPIPGTRIIGTVAQLPWRTQEEEKRAYAKHFWEVVAKITGKGGRFSTESLRREWNNLSKVFEYSEEIILAEREASLVGQNLSALVQEDLDSSVAIGDIAERTTLALDSAKKITQAVGGGPSIQHNGGIQAAGKYLKVKSIFTSGLTRVQNIRHAISTARSEDGTTIVSMRYSPKYAYESSEPKFNLSCIEHFRASLLISIARELGLNENSTNEEILDIIKRANEELIKTETPEVLEVGGNILHRSILNEIANGYLAQYMKAIDAMHFLAVS